MKSSNYFYCFCYINAIVLFQYHAAKPTTFSKIGQITEECGILVSKYNKIAYLKGFNMIGAILFHRVSVCFDVVLPFHDHVERDGNTAGDI